MGLERCKECSANYREGYEAGKAAARCRQYKKPEVRSTRLDPLFVYLSLLRIEAMLDSFEVVS
jgi:hypothetical protein